MTFINSRRDFLKTAATATAAVAAVNLLPGTLPAASKIGGLGIILNPQDAEAKPVQWVVRELRDAVRRRGAAAEIFSALEQAPAGFDRVIAATAGSSDGKRALSAAGISLPDVPEAVGLGRSRIGNRRILVACGSDVRGLVYALLELTDRVN